MHSLWSSVCILVSIVCACYVCAGNLSVTGYLQTFEDFLTAVLTFSIFSKHDLQLCKPCHSQ